MEHIKRITAGQDSSVSGKNLRLPALAECTKYPRPDTVQMLDIETNKVNYCDISDF